MIQREGILLSVNASEDDFIDSEDERERINEDAIDDHVTEPDLVSEVDFPRQQRRWDQGQGDADGDDPSVMTLDVNNPALMKLVNDLVDKRMKQDKSTQDKGTNKVVTPTAKKQTVNNIIP